MEKEELIDYCKQTFLNKHGNFNSAKVRKGMNRAAEIEHLLDKYVKGRTQVEKIYLLLHGMSEPPICPTCGKSYANFNTYSRGHTTYCSMSCAAKAPETTQKKRETNLERFGVPFNREAIDKAHETRKNQPEEEKERQADKLRKTWNQKSDSEIEGIVEKRRNTSNERYGVDNPSKSPAIKERIQFTFQERYGVNSASEIEGVREKQRQTLMARYGANNPLQSKEIHDKVKKTNIERYGVETPFQSKEIKEKIRATSMERYGVPHPQMSKEILDRRVQSYYDNFFTRLLSLERLQNRVKPLFKREEYKGHKELHLWECQQCGTHFEDNIDNGTLPRCPTCYPPFNGDSHYERDLIDWIENTLKIDRVVKHKRSIIAPYELDVYLPDYSLAIEFNGLFWHSERQGGKDKNYHINKTLRCEEKGISLIHIFEDEWVDKEEIVKSVIRGKLGLNTKLYARKCDVEEIPSSEASLFLDDNHLQGSVPSKVNIVLRNGGEIVSVLSLSKPRFNSNYEWEITRFSTKKGYSVIGGFARMLSYFDKVYGGSIITYSDRRYFDGGIYLSNGFEFSGSTTPNYFYINNDVYRYNRIRFQKHKLKEEFPQFDESLTEWENMQLNGWDRIWDCGNNVYVRT